MRPEKGQRWRYNTLNPMLISAKSLPPQWVGVTIEWVDDANVHYRKDSSPAKVEQTPIERFLEIAEPIVMDISAYCDGIIDLLDKAGVTAEEIAALEVSEKLAHGHMKGVPFERAAEDMLKLFGISVE